VWDISYNPTRTASKIKVCCPDLCGLVYPRALNIIISLSTCSLVKSHPRSHIWERLLGSLPGFKSPHLHFSTATVCFFTHTAQLCEESNSSLPCVCSSDIINFLAPRQAHCRSSWILSLLDIPDLLHNGWRPTTPPTKLTDAELYIHAQ